ncbi:MAG: hypothetical protein K0S01_3963 [Herbinix sp.]|jgi:hypothetical protein|nr:hypothetical protein [Herbinix sp.]
MKDKMIAIFCYLVIVMILTGCGSANNPISSDMSSNSNTTVITLAPIDSEEKKETKSLDTVCHTSDMVYAQGDIPRLYITTSNYQNKLNSLSNLALDKKATANSCESDCFRPSYLVDGNATTRWASCYEDNEYFIIDLGESKQFSYININWESAYGKEYTIYASDDNANWSPIVNEKNGNAGVLEYSFNEVTARYIKWQGIKRGTEYGYSIFEFGVYSVSTSAQVSSDVNELESTYLNTFTEEYQPVSIAITDCTGGTNEIINDNEAIICIRGNSTALTNKLSYNFKLSSKKDVLGLGEGRKWCLLANHFDKTMLRNKISYDFADNLGLPIKLGTEFVDLYIDNVYEGLYLLSEPVSDGKNRVDIDITAGEFIFERCTHNEKASKEMFQSPIYNLNLSFKAPDYDEITEDQKKQLNNFIGKVEEAIKSEKQSEIEKIIDIDSFAAMYVFEELFKNVDYSFDSNYFYIKGGKLYAGPIWDMDLSMGNVSSVYEFEPYYIYNNSIINGITYGNGSGNSTEGTWALSGWYELLMNYDFFKQLVANKFDLVEDSFKQIYSDGGVIDQLVHQYKDALERNYCNTYWDLTKTYSRYERETPDDTYIGNTEFLKNWLRKRNEWVYGNK